jgi:hypothetical protein
MMSGHFPRWIRQSPDTDVCVLSVAGLWDSVSAAEPSTGGRGGVAPRRGAKAAPTCGRVVSVSEPKR